MKQSAKRLISMFLALFFITAAFVVFFDLVQPAYGQAEELHSELLGEQSSLSLENGLVQQAQNLINAYKNASQDQEAVSLTIPAGGQDLAGALTQIEGIAQNASMAISSVAVSNPTLVPQIASPSNQATSTQIVKPLGSFTIKLVGSASYEDIRNFLSQIETNIRIFDVQSMSFIPAAQAASVTKGSVSDLFNYDISVKTYYQVP